MGDVKLGGHPKYNGKIKPFGKHCYSSILHELKPVFHDARFFRIIWLGFLNLSCLLVLLSWCHSTKSLGLRSFTYIIVFDTLSLFICALRIWVEQKKPNTQYTFGYERFEVLAIFLSAAFSFISAIFLIKKSIERWIYPIPVPLGQITSGVLLAFVCHMIMTYCMKNKGLNLVICASNTAILEKRLTALSQNFCTNVSGLSAKFSPRFNPFVLLGWGSLGILLCSQFVVDIYQYDGADSIGAIVVSIVTCVVMYPLCAYSAKILLQGTPPHIADLLDKSLREASTLDGVLEFRNEHFWLLGYDKIVGSLHVRIRRDANEQVVLSHLLSKLSSLVPDLTIQVFKDEWSWSSSTMQILNESFKKFPPSSSSINLKASALSDKSALPYSTMSGSSYSKLLYPSSGGSETIAAYSSRMEDSHSSSALAQPSQRQTVNDVCSVDIPGESKQETVTSRQSHSSNFPRASRTESGPNNGDRNSSISSIYSSNVDVGVPYNT